MTDRTACVDWGVTNTNKFFKFVDQVREVAPDFTEWCEKASNVEYNKDSTIDVETHMLYFFASQANVMSPDLYMKFAPVDLKKGWLIDDYYNLLQYAITNDAELFNEIGKL